MNKIFLYIFSLLVAVDLLLISLFFVYKIQNEKTLLTIRTYEQSASFYRVEGQKAYAMAMLEKQEAERKRKEYYVKSYGEMGLEYYDNALK